MPEQGLYTSICTNVTFYKRIVGSFILILVDLFARRRYCHYIARHTIHLFHLWFYVRSYVVVSHVANSSRGTLNGCVHWSYTKSSSSENVPRTRHTGSFNSSLVKAGIGNGPSCRDTDVSCQRQEGRPYASRLWVSPDIIISVKEIMINPRSITLLSIAGRAYFKR